MLVHIVYAVTADKLGPDLTRMGNLEEVPDELGRVLLQDGSARIPSAEERADWEATREAREAADAGDLTRLSKADLLRLANDRGADVPPHATKADLLDAIEDHAAVHPAPTTVDVPLPDAAWAEPVSAEGQPQ